MTKNEFLQKYGKDHIIVYMGYDVQVKREPKPLKDGVYLCEPDASAVFIDDMNYGSAERPFSCFDVGPGLHKIEFRGIFAGVRSDTDPKPARVKEGQSLYFSVKVVKCMTGIYYFIKDFDNLDAFLANTGARLY